MRTLRICAFAALSSLLLSAEEAESAKFYRLQFVVKEVDGSKVLNARSCMTVIGISQSGAIRNRTKVPVPAAPNSAAYQFADVGIDFDYGPVKEIPTGLTMHLKADTSGILQESSGNMMPTPIRNYQWNSTITVPLGKPTVVFSSDDLASKHTMEVELTATPVK